jgi:holo-[acyl-carrier protein] synthase
MSDRPTFPRILHGVDLVAIGEMRRAMTRTETFEARVFTEGEREYCHRHADPHIHFAGRFAAKEAALKALGVGLSGVGLHTGLHDVEVISGKGPPLLRLGGKAAQIAADLGIGTMSLSITHTKENAVASVVMLASPDPMGEAPGTSEDTDEGN